MSNFLAIATVTATLCKTMQEAINLDSGDLGATVSSVRPDGMAETDKKTTANVFLYQVNPNLAWRNSDLPTRKKGGELIQNPRVALDLYYLFTFFGDETQLAPQRMLGSVVRAIHGRPILSRKMVEKTINDQSYSYLAESDLHHEVELVKFTPLNFNLEELSKLWSVFFQTPYALSVAYRGTVVLIESNGVPASPLLVKARKLISLPFRKPVVERVFSTGDANQPLLAEDELIITGNQLTGEITRVRIGEAEINILEGRETRIKVRIAPQSLRAGALGLQVLHFIRKKNGEEMPSAESTVFPIVLCPKIVGDTVVMNPSQDADSGTWSAWVTVPLSPTPREGQRARLLLNEQKDDNPASYVFSLAPLEEDTALLTFHVKGMKAGKYLVRVVVDGAESPLETDNDSNSPTFGRYVRPEMLIGTG